jgi:hypothetical protein
MRSPHTFGPEGSARSSGSRVRRPTRTTRLMVKLDMGAPFVDFRSDPKLRRA